MRITGYRSLRTAHDWGRPVGDTNGVLTAGTTEVAIVLVDTDAGITGVGLGAHPLIETVFPAIVGEDPRAVTALYDRMLAHVFKTGHSGAVFGAIGALDMALWDLKAKAADEPLWRTLGARERSQPAYASALDAGLDDEILVATYSRFAEHGFTAAKLKGGRDVDHDLRRFGLVADVFEAASGRKPDLMLDTNESWSAAQGLRYMARLEREIDLVWLEEPVRRWDASGHARLRHGIRAAIATGENLTGLEHFKHLISAGAVDVLQTGSVWGVSHFLRVANLAHSFDLQISAVAYNANPMAHGSVAVPNSVAIEVQDLKFPRGLTVDQRFENGQLILGDSPGLGIVVDEDVCEPVEVTAGSSEDQSSLAGRSDGGWGKKEGPHVRPPRAGRRMSITGNRDD